MVQDMTKGTPWKLILYFTVPVLIGNIFQQLYSMVDTIIVGRFVGNEALAAVGSTGALSFLVLGFAIGLAGGFTVVVSQRFGADDFDGMRRAIGMAIILAVAVTVILTAISMTTTDWLLGVMNTPENIYEDARIYIMVIYAGIGASVYYNLIAGILRSVRDSKTPLVFLIISSF